MDSVVRYYSTGSTSSKELEAFNCIQLKSSTALQGALIQDYIFVDGERLGCLIFLVDKEPFYFSQGSGQTYFNKAFATTD